MFLKNKTLKNSNIILLTPMLVLIVAVLLQLTSCNRNRLDGNGKLVFSNDTIFFDTVFTTLSSSTRMFTVINPTSDVLSVDISLAGGKQSFYSMNVDGVAGTDFRGVEIPARDSIFIFVKVNINPTNQNNPYLVSDSIMFYTEKSKQNVQLVAFGQDAHFILPDHTLSTMRYSVVAGEHEHVHWTNDKPWVIYGWAVVDSLGKLTIDPGTKIYVHSGGGIWVYKDGNININGTTDNPVIIRGDRLESFFDNDYAQWDRLWICEGIEDNIINNAIISNSSIGLQVSALDGYPTNKTIVNNSIIHNNQTMGVLGRSANLEMNNCQISNNGQAGLTLQIGNYELNHLTVANYFSQSARKYPTVIVQNNYSGNEIDENGEVMNVVYIGNTNITINNSIIYGNLTNEFATSTVNGADMNFKLNNCIVKRDSMDNTHYTNCINKDPKFISKYNQDYNIEETSPAIDAGMSGLGIFTDILGRARNGIPDIGAYEYYPESNDRLFR